MREREREEEGCGKVKEKAMGGGWMAASPLVEMKAKPHLFEGSRLQPQQHTHTVTRNLLTSASLPLS